MVENKNFRCYCLRLFQNTHRWPSESVDGILIFFLIPKGTLSCTLNFLAYDLVEVAHLVVVSLPFQLWDRIYHDSTHLWNNDISLQNCILICVFDRTQMLLTRTRQWLKDPALSSIMEHFTRTMLHFSYSSYVNSHANSQKVGCSKHDG
jgi:hypothetical protein